MDIEKILAVTLSGVRDSEQPAVKDLIVHCGLNAADLTSEKLRHFLVARKGEEIIGVVGIEVSGEDALLRSLAVADAFQDKGIAARLIVSIERYARQANVGTIYLLTLTNRAFFAKQGYHEIERGNAPRQIQATEEFQRLGTGNALCMRKALNR